MKGKAKMTDIDMNGNGDEDFSENDMTEHLRQIAEILCENISVVTCCSVRLVEDDMLALKALYGFAKNGPREEKIPLEDTIAGAAIFQKKPIAIKDIRKEKKYNFSKSHEGLVSLLAMPIFWKEKALGVIQLYTLQEHVFVEKEVKLVQYLAAPLIGLAVKYAKINNRRLLALLEVSKALSSKSDLEDMFETIVDRAAHVLGIKRCALFLLSEIGDKICLEAGFPKCDHGIGLERELREYPAVREVIESQNWLLIENPQSHELTRDSAALSRTYGINAILFVPLVFERKILGAFTFDATGNKKTFLPQEIGVCRIMANISSAAIARAREQERFQKEMTAKNRMEILGKAAADIAHEIRNPLTSIGGFARRILKKADDPQKVLEYGNIIVKETDRLEQIVGEVLEYSRQKELNLVRANLNNLIHETVKLLEIVFSDKRITVLLNLAEETVEMQLDAVKIKSVLTNILRNAVEALSENVGEKQIWIETHQTKTHVELVIKNNISAPLSQEILENMFNPFFTTKANGTGLGLAIVDSVIRLHKGYIKVDHDGQKIAFNIRLPR